MNKVIEPPQGICTNCSNALDAGQFHCPICGSSGNQNRKGPFPKWLVVIFLLIAPFATCGACTVINQRRNEYGYDFLNTPIMIEAILVVAGIVMLIINTRVEWDNKS
jgi:hypothetical protein